MFRRGETAKGAGLMLKGVEAMLRYRSHFLVRHVIETVANGLAGGGISPPAAVLWAAMDATGAGGLARNLRNPALPEKVEADLSLTELTAARRHGSQLTLDQAVGFVIETLRSLVIGDRSDRPSQNQPGVAAQD